MKIGYTVNSNMKYLIFGSINMLSVECMQFLNECKYDLIGGCCTAGECWKA